MAGRLFALVRAFVVGVAFVSIWTWFVPRWMAGGELRPEWNAGIVLMLVGAAIAVRCVWDFAWTGQGTPAPFDPPRRLVVTGPYRWVRNPMYVGLGVLLVGEAIVLPQVRLQMFALVGFLWMATTTFIIVYEEPVLRRLFGPEYEEYCRQVHRWMPRFTPFDNAKGAAVRSAHLE